MVNTVKHNQDLLDLLDLEDYVAGVNRIPDPSSSQFSDPNPQFSILNSQFSTPPHESRTNKLV
jgi:hypothetical protein